MLQMDDALGIDPRRRASRVLREQLVAPLGVGRFVSLDVDRAEASLAHALAFIDAWDGVDVVLHGIGENAHLGYNEPGSAHDARGGVVALATSTRRAFLRQWGDAPTHGLTLGLASLLSARES